MTGSPTPATTATGTAGDSGSGEATSALAKRPRGRPSSSAKAAGQTTTQTSSAGANQTRRAKRQYFTRTNSPSFKKDVAVMRAEGMTIKSVAKALNVSDVTVSRTQRLPEVKEHIRSLRELWKKVSQEQVTAVGTAAWGMAEDSVKQRSSKDFDNTVRGLVGLEKISASVAEEASKVELVNPPSPHVELRLILAQLLGTDDARGK